MELKTSDLVAAAALVVSCVALYQTRDANSPKIVVTPVAERSFTTCNRKLGEWQTRTVMRFNVSNIGGRAATLERLTALPGIAPVTVQTAEGSAASTNYSIVRLEQLGDLPDGSAAPSWDLNKVFYEGRSVTLTEDRKNFMAPPLLNIAVEPGKSVTLDFGVSTNTYEGSARIEAVHLALQASFSHQDSIVLRTGSETQRIIARGGRCLREAQ